MLAKQFTFNHCCGPDPDPSNPWYVFGPPGSGSRSISQRYGSADPDPDPNQNEKRVRKPFIPSSLTFFLLLSLKNDVNVKVISRKTFFLYFVGILRVNDEYSRIRIH